MSMIRATCAIAAGRFHEAAGARGGEMANLRFGSPSSEYRGQVLGDQDEPDATLSPGTIALISVGSSLCCLLALLGALGLRSLRRRHHRLFAAYNQLLARQSGTRGVQELKVVRVVRGDSTVLPEHEGKGGKGQDAWEVIVLLPDGTTSPPMPLLKSTAHGELGELKSSIALLCLSNLGAEATPPEWIDAPLDTMLVEFESSAGGWETIPPEGFEGALHASRLRAFASTTSG
ncbi:hypothetical protein AB1Y20_015681 [Prymnesium parvum]|uniref:Uncharacterized protein n=1 Tax=Prymnesium parvum TaxID=97485 RepID=A0AB34K153_PRYPA